MTADALISCLRKLTPRMYSIASCQDSVGDEVHLTVALVNYDAFGQPHYGGASGYLNRRVPPGASIKVFAEDNHNFRLPVDTQAPIIMIGPGTGIAPFRAFMQQRKTVQQCGDNWLIFGNPHRESDFLYEEEWLALQSEGILTRIDVAFSRDQAEKVYVQHRILEHATDFYRWLERGAYLYICGDATHMAQDVQTAILQVIQQQAGKSPQQAEAYLDQLKQEKRYQKDVY
jgi:sulfite reductase (NADPH) flavoprotein alpha-component